MAEQEIVRPRPVSQYIAVADANARDKNKENHPNKLRFVDPQPGAKSVTWESQEPVPRHSIYKRQRTDNTEDDAVDHLPKSKRPRSELFIESEIDDSEDEGFQADQRDLEPRRNPVAATRQVRGSSVGTMRRIQQHAEAQLQASARQADEDGEIEDDAPPPSSAKVKLIAKTAAMLSRDVPQTQRRIAWSVSDEQLLIDMIADFGPQYSVIWKQANFAVERDQVALKDKARNLKVAYLK